MKLSHLIIVLIIAFFSLSIFPQAIEKVGKHGKSIEKDIRVGKTFNYNEWRPNGYDVYLYNETSDHIVYRLNLWTPGTHLLYRYIFINVTKDSNVIVELQAADQTEFEAEGSKYIYPQAE